MLFYCQNKSNLITPKKREKLRNFKDFSKLERDSSLTFADYYFTGHCEAERSEAVAIAKSLELNEITTYCATPRNDCVILNCQSVSEQRLKGFAKAKTATPFIASEQERHDNILNIGGTCQVILNFAKRTNEA